MLVAGNQVGVTTLAELIAVAKARPGAITFSSSGIGTGTHLGVEKLNLEAHIETVHVPARGPDAIADTIGHTVAGRTDYAMSPIPMALPYIREQRLAALGVSTARRSRLLPEVPTLAEAGATGFDFPIWYGIWAPVGTPARVVNKLSEDIARVLAEPDLRGWLVEHDGDPMRMGQAEFASFVLERERERGADHRSRGRARLEWFLSAGSASARLFSQRPYSRRFVPSAIRSGLMSARPGAGSPRFSSSAQLVPGARIERAPDGLFEGEELLLHLDET